MRQFRISMKLNTTYITPFHADTIFGHFCWAIAELEGDAAVTEFLNAFAVNPPLLVSDGFPKLGDVMYLPCPVLPAEERDRIMNTLKINKDDKNDLNIFASAFKKVNKNSIISDNVLKQIQDKLEFGTIPIINFNLRVCPKSMQKRDDTKCNCKSWRECYYLNPKSSKTEPVICREMVKPLLQTTEVMHNAINRITNASENLFTQEEKSANHDIAFLVTIDEDIFNYDRLTASMNYLKGNGYGKDRSTGKGAITEYKIEDYELSVPADANAFISLSSGYVPQSGEIGEIAWYQPYVKYGKLGGKMATADNPFKKPVMMLRAGAVIGGQSNKHYGTLIRDIHWEYPHIVQYGYAYPMWIKVEVKNG